MSRFGRRPYREEAEEIARELASSTSTAIERLANLELSYSVVDLEISFSVVDLEVRAA